MIKAALKVFLFYSFLLLFSLLHVLGQENTSFLTQQEVVEGSFLVYFIDDTEEIIDIPTVLFPTTDYSFDSQVSSSILGDSDRILRIDNATSNNYVDLAIAPDLSSTGNFENDAKWFSSGSSYPIYSPNVEDGRLAIDPFSSSFDTTNCQPNLLNLGTLSHFIFVEPDHEENIESIDLFAFSHASVCRMELQGIDLIQTIPPIQSPGIYELEMVLTATTMSFEEPTNYGYPYLQWQLEQTGDFIIEVESTSTVPIDWTGIYDATELKNVENDMSAKYILMNDIDLDGENFEPIGYASGSSLTEFTGHFNGNGYKIFNGTIDYPSDDKIGLFAGTDEGAIIENLGVEIDITGNIIVGSVVGLMWDSLISNCYARGNVSGTYRVGGLLGDAVEGTVMNSYATGNVIGSHLYIGGLIGYNDSSSLEKSYATGNVEGDTQVGGLIGDFVKSSGFEPYLKKSYALGNVLGDFNVGGLIGSMSNISVENSYAIGNVTGDNYVGGLIGYVDDGPGPSNITNCYSTGKVTSNNIVGGLVGMLQGSEHTLEDSFYDAYTSGQSDTDRGLPKTTSEMRQQSTFEPAWDFDTIWAID